MTACCRRDGAFGHAAGMCDPCVHELCFSTISTQLQVKCPTCFQSGVLLQSMAANSIWSYGRWAYRNPLSITNSSATDLGEGSYNGTVNSTSNIAADSTLVLRYSHGATSAFLPNGSFAVIWQVGCRPLMESVATLVTSELCKHTMATPRLRTAVALNAPVHASGQSPKSKDHRDFSSCARGIPLCGS